MLYNIALWQDHHIQNFVSFQTKVLDTFERLGNETDQDHKFFTRLSQMRELLEENPSFITRPGITFHVPRTDHLRWTNEVEVWVSLEERLSVPKERFHGRVTCRAQISGDVPADAVQYAELLSKIAAAAVEMDADLQKLISSLGKKPEDKAKVKRYEDRRERRMFVATELRKKVGSAFGNLHEFCEGMLGEFLKKAKAEARDVRDLADLVIVRRFEGKERKLLNQVPETVFEVSHERGGPSTIRPTPATLDSLMIRLEDAK